MVYLKYMNELDQLVNKFVFKGLEKRAFSSNKEDCKMLIDSLKKNKVKISTITQKGYFYCEMKTNDMEVVADSRANIRPKNMNEAVCIAALKIYMTDTASNWKKVIKALKLDTSKFKK